MNDLERVMAEFNLLAEAFLNNEEFFKKYAAVHYKMFQALIDEGFSREEALKVLTSANTPISLT